MGQVKTTFRAKNHEEVHTVTGAYGGPAQFPAQHNGRESGAGAEELVQTTLLRSPSG